MYVAQVLLNYPNNHLTTPHIYFVTPLCGLGTTEVDRLTRARAAYDAVVDDGAAVDCNLQAVVCIVVLGGFVIRIELQQRQKQF